VRQCGASTATIIMMYATMQAKTITQTTIFTQMNYCFKHACNDDSDITVSDV